MRNRKKTNKGFTPLEISRFKRLSCRSPKAKSGSLTGFTLMELMIALGVFVVVVVIISSIFVNSVKINRIISKRTAAIDNVSLVIEQIAREIRTGVRFDQLNDLGTGQIKKIDGKGDDGFYFVNYKGQTVRYRLNKGAIEKEIIKGEIGGHGGHGPLRISSAGVDIKKLAFWASNNPPRITIVIEASGGPLAKPLNLQTTVGARLIYYKEAR